MFSGWTLFGRSTRHFRDSARVFNRLAGVKKLKSSPSSRYCYPGNFRATLWENGGPLVDLNTLIPQNSPLTLVYAVNINDRGEIAGLGVPAGCAVPDVSLCGHALMLIPDGDCDQDNEARIAESQRHADLMRQVPVPVTVGAEPALTPIERFRTMMRQRYHLPESQPLRWN